MEVSQHKIHVKPSVPAAVGSNSPVAHSPSIATGQPIVIRAKVSGSARTRSQTSASSVVSASGPPRVRNAPVRATLTPDAGVRPSSPTKFTVRSPSPSKFMRPLSPFKPSQQAKPTPVRPPAPASMSKVASHLARVDKNSTSVITVFDDNHTTAPSSPSLFLQNKDGISDRVAKGGASSLRIKAKVTSMTKPPPVPTIVSPPSPPSTISSIPSPIMSARPRVRALTTVRRPSVHLPTAVDESLLIPLPTSPPTSTLSFSSHSSTSISSIHSSSTNDADTPPITRSSFLKRDLTTDTLVAPEERTAEEPKPPKPYMGNLIARVRSDTRISGGNGRTSRDSFSSENNDSVGKTDSLSDEDDTLAHAPKTLRSPSQEREEEERAEAKSNRKIADLEITTKSLLAINTSLEAAKARQASEIRDLRRKLRQARLALPPKSYKLLAADNQELEENDGEDGESTDVDEEEDECFQRMKHMLDDLLITGRKALAVPAPSFKIDTLESLSAKHSEREILAQDSYTNTDDNLKRDWKHGVAIGNRVLSAEEAKQWTENNMERDLDDTQEDADTSHADTLEEEEEVEKEIEVAPSINLTPDIEGFAQDDTDDSPANIDIPP